MQDVSFEDWQMPRLDRPPLRESTWSTSLKGYTGDLCAVSGYQRHQNAWESDGGGNVLASEK